MDERGPVEVTVSRLELRCENHRAAINRIHTYRAVITPARQVSGLRSASYQNRRFVAQRSQRIGGTAISVANARHNRARGDVISNGDAASLVHRGASHPSKIV